jgi:methylenetetrahydrofolate dehydrogenase (NADP+)/methenyltetrahydrofolate cyclohydrolase
MKVLNGAELADYVMERQAREVRALRQAWDVFPKLAIVVTTDDPVIQTYIKLKQQYGEEVLVEVAVHRIAQSEAAETIQSLNADPSVHGIIIQLPLADPEQTDDIVNMVAPEKDVDALGEQARFDPATPMAIMWLLAGYNIDLQQGKQVVLVGKGRLVGAPLERLLLSSGVNVTAVDRDTENKDEIIAQADVIITATGVPGAVSSAMIKRGAVVVDAGVAAEQGKTVGDLADDVYERDDLALTPKKGGVGPLTVCALFDNVIRSARRVAENSATPAQT